MEKLHSYIHTSLQLIQSYEGEMPLHLFLKKHFRMNKKFGSRDRRWIKTMTYSWFRAGEMFAEMESVHRLLSSFYLVQNIQDAKAEEIMLNGGLQFESIDFTLDYASKLNWIEKSIGKVDREKCFPVQFKLTEELDRESFFIGLLQQPKVWLRVRKGKMNLVKTELEASEISYSIHSEISNAISIDQGVSLDKLKMIEAGNAEIQDISSQKTLQFMPANSGESWYDACAASGGKSLLLMDAVEGIHLTVSDSRESILVNLKERFKRNKISKYESMIVDFTIEAHGNFKDRKFDGIIADVPCSGSGTWARTPEQMNLFSDAKLKHYLSLQKIITEKLCLLLPPRGKLTYITCSVFKAENEDRVMDLVKNHQMILLEEKLFQGTEEGADTLYAALLEKS